MPKEGHEPRDVGGPDELVCAGKEILFRAAGKGNCQQLDFSSVRPYRTTHLHVM